MMLKKSSGPKFRSGDWLSKPFGLSEMKARVKALLRRNKGADALESEFEFGKLHISIFI
jgi:DNA-binding response OmpR family regulator